MALSGYERLSSSDAASCDINSVKLHVENGERQTTTGSSATDTSLNSATSWDAGACDTDVRDQTEENVDDARNKRSWNEIVASLGRADLRALRRYSKLGWRQQLEGQLPPTVVAQATEAEETFSQRKISLLAMLDDLNQCYAETSFQEKLQGLREAAYGCQQPCQKTRVSPIPGRAELVEKVQSIVLPRHGFLGSREGVSAMMQALRPYIDDEDVLKRMSLSDDLLQCPPDAIPGDCWMSKKLMQDRGHFEIPSLARETLMVSPYLEVVGF